MAQDKFSGLSMEDKDPLIRLLHKVIRLGVKALAVFLPMVSDMSGCSGNQAAAVLSKLGGL